MNSIPNNTFPSFDDTDDPLLSLRFHQGLQYEPISFDDLQSDDFLFDFGDFDPDAHAFPPSQVPPQGGLLPRDVRPFPHITSPNAPSLPQPGILPPVALEPTFNVSDGVYTLLSQPSASHHAGPSSTAFDDGEQQQASFSGIQNIPVPTPAVAPASAPASSTSSVNWMNPVQPVAPTFGWSTGAPTPVVRTWDAMAASMGATTGASASAEPRQVPLPFWSSGRRYPLVRVDDTIEWVRPDVMRMVVYFNFSLNAEDEAHASWEPRI